MAVHPVVQPDGIVVVGAMHRIQGTPGRGCRYGGAARVTASTPLLATSSFGSGGIQGSPASPKRAERDGAAAQPIPEAPSDVAFAAQAAIRP